MSRCIFIHLTSSSWVKMMAGFATLTLFILCATGRVNIDEVKTNYEQNLSSSHWIWDGNISGCFWFHLFYNKLTNLMTWYNWKWFSRHLLVKPFFFLSFRCFSVGADHSVARLHLRSSRWLGRNALLPEWHKLWLSVLVQAAERKSSPVNSVHISKQHKLRRRIQVWFWGGEFDEEEVVSDDTEL